jgi:hypothetical protein
MEAGVAFVTLRFHATGRGVKHPVEISDTAARRIKHVRDFEFIEFIRNLVVFCLSQ